MDTINSTGGKVIDLKLVAGSKLKLCPFCGFEGYVWKRPNDEEVAKCSNKNCPLHIFNFTVQEWQYRPGEDGLQWAIDTLKSVVEELKTEYDDLLSDHESKLVVLTHNHMSLFRELSATLSERDTLQKKLVACERALSDAMTERDMESVYVDELQVKLDNTKAENKEIVELITAMYDRVHEERDALQSKLDTVTDAFNGTEQKIEDLVKACERQRLRAGRAEDICDAFEVALRDIDWSGYQVCMDYQDMCFRMSGVAHRALKKREDELLSSS